MPATRVLLVDDEESIRLVFRYYLQSQSIEVIEASDGAGAIALLESIKDIDILFTDVRMPGSIDGIRVALFARSMYPQIPVIMMSGYSWDNSDQLNLLTEPVVFIRKPCSFDEVKKALNRFTSR